MKKMAEIFYGNSFGCFASAFIGERKVSKEELKKLRGRGMSRQGLKYLLLADFMQVCSKYLGTACVIGVVCAGNCVFWGIVKDS